MSWSKISGGKTFRSKISRGETSWSKKAGGETSWTKNVRGRNDLVRNVRERNVHTVNPKALHMDTGIDGWKDSLNIANMAKYRQISVSIANIGKYC